MRALCAVILVAAATPAHAGVVVGEGVPFSAADLEDALVARTPAATQVTVQVQVIAPARVQVIAPGGRWEVELGDARGPVAARLVALHVVEQSGGDLAGVLHSPARTAWWRRAGVTVAAGASRGVEGDDLASAVAGLELIVGRRWWLGAGVEWREGLEVTPTDAAPVAARMGLVRGLVGRSIGPLELAAGPLIGRLSVDSGSHASAWSAGVAGAVRGRWRLARCWSLVVGVGADAYRHRIEVRRAGQPVAATPRIALAATLGLRWELGR